MKKAGGIAGLLASTSTTPGGNSTMANRTRSRPGKRLFTKLDPSEIIRIEKSTPFVRQGRLESAEGSAVPENGATEEGKIEATLAAMTLSDLEIDKN